MCEAQGGVESTSYHGRIELDLSNSDFRSNKAKEHGGALSILGENVTCRLGKNSTFKGNIAAQSGGAVAIRDGPAVQITRVHFSSNSAGAFGGAIWAQGVDNQTTMKVEGSQFSLNRGVHGGGAFLAGSKLTANFTTIIFVGNSAAVGGGLFVSNGPSANIQGAVFKQNEAVKEGGGVFAEVG